MHCRPAARTAAALAWTALAAGAIAASGCNEVGTHNPYNDPFWAHRVEPGAQLVPRVQAGPRSLAMFEGDNGATLDWYALSSGIRWADVVIVGEQHDDANAHGVQRAILADTIAAWPGSALSMEMLERNEQPIVDAYLRGEIGRDEFIDRTDSRNWAGKDTWVRFYQPIVDEAKSQKCPVVAANAPRQYVRRASTEGYDALAALPPEERALFSLPLRDPPEDYRARFKALMTGDGAHAVDEARVDEVLRSQRLWDATMADSIATALKDLPRDAKVVHLVGQFHSEHEGGLVSELRARAPFAKVLTVTIQQGTTLALRSEDIGKADVVVYGVAPSPTWRMFSAGPAPDDAKTKTAAPEEEPPSWGFAY
jgi:uncharacterized iron-regulated protein